MPDSTSDTSSDSIPDSKVQLPVREPLEAKLNRLIEANKAGFAELAAMGAQVDGAGLLNLRIDILAEMVLGTGPGILQFRLRFESKVAEVLEELRGQVRKAQLAAAAQASPQQVKQMAAAQGLLLD